MTAKEYMYGYLNAKKKIETLKMAQEKVREEAVNITQRLQENKVQGGGTRDKIGDAAAKLADLDHRIDLELIQLVETMGSVVAIINKVHNSTFQALLICRYINGMTLEQTAEVMGYATRHIVRLHGYALLQVADALNAEQCHRMS